MDLVSVIVPIYNVEKYIFNCVTSIINQSYENLEIILINDGSEDDSLAIIKKISIKDKRVKIINKENAGVSSARNTGLDICSGKYVVFVDGDDYLEPNYIAYFVSLIKEYDGDMAISYNNYGENYQDIDDKKGVITPTIAMKELYLNKINVAVWNKIYKREILKKNNLRFNENFWFAEGMTFNIEYFQKCKKIVTCYALLYHQVENPESAVRKFRLESWKCGLKAMKYQKEHWTIKDKKVKDAWTYHYRCYNGEIWSGLVKSGQASKYPNEIIKCKKGFKKGVFSCLRTEVPLKRKIKCVIEYFYPEYFYNKK